MKLKHIIWLAALIATLLGCGGSGGGTAASSAPMFVTDNLDNHSHVWITIKQVVFASANGDVTAYSDPVGATIDLRALHDNSGKLFAFLTSVPAGTYTGVTVTVDKTVTLFDQGNPTGFTRVFAGNNGSTADLTLTFGAPKTLGPGIPFALDFDLQNWSDDGTTITGNPFLGDASGDSGIGDDSRHEHREHEGTVQDLTGTAPDQTFTLVHEHHSVTVITNAQTVLLNSDGSVSPALADGQRVHVRGIYDMSQSAIVADSIMIQRGGDGNHDSPRAEGSIESFDAGAFTFVLTIDEAHGFLPTMTTVNVTTTADTVFCSHRGSTLTQADFFAALAAGNHVEVEGSYDSGTNTLAAAKVHLEDGDGGGDHHSQVQGPISAVDGTAFTFDVTAHEWEGMNISNGTVVHVVTTGDTVFGEGNITRELFFGSLSAGTSLEVDGTFDSTSTTLTADKVKIHN